MAIRTVRTVGDAVLEKKCREVKEMTPRIEELIDDMFDTMYENNGVGLAAPQVGVLRRVIVVDTGDDPRVLINPWNRTASRPERKAVCPIPASTGS